MKNVVLLFVLVSFCGFAQNYVDDKEVISDVSFKTNNSQLNYAANQQILQTPVLKNSVFIAQVGLNNTAISQIASDNAEVTIVQDGNFNISNLKINALRVREQVQQIGNSNLFLDYSLHGAQNHEVQLNQNGNYNTAISVGTNGISERLKINQTGTGTAVYVLHY